MLKSGSVKERSMFAFGEVFGIEALMELDTKMGYSFWPAATVNLDIKAIAI